MLSKTKLNFRQIEWWGFSAATFLLIAIGFLNFIYPFRNDTFFYLAASGTLFLGLFYFLRMRLWVQFRQDGKKWKFGLLSLLLLGLGFALHLLFAEIMHGGLGPAPIYFRMLLLFGLYAAFVLLLDQIAQQRGSQDLRWYNGIRLALFYLFLTLYLFQFSDGRFTLLTRLFAFYLPFVAVVSFVNFFFIYGEKRAGNPAKATRNYGFLVSAILLGGLLLWIGNPFAVFISAVWLLFVVVVLIIPISDLLFARYEDNLQQLTRLNVQVNRNAAQLAFLESQINPHFIFNTLNSIYGTALQEGAERTGEAITKLGELMRYMFTQHEKAKIPVQEELSYIENFVSLQRLRFQQDDNPEISLQVQLEEGWQGTIAPMLLIPFVENAFKHGVSVQHKSWIKVHVKGEGEVLHFHVTNSVHAKQGEDPEGHSHGVGVENVRQRLALLYPKRHELKIYEAGDAFFVHLSIFIV
ncbi:MAG: sensor histidine kinase [Nitritalea sp.]